VVLIGDQENNTGESFACFHVSNKYNLRVIAKHKDNELNFARFNEIIDECIYKQDIGCLGKLASFSIGWNATLK
jgi:hypothetical protein